MPDESAEFREKLMSAQAVSPGLRDAYQKEVETMTNPALTPRATATGVALLIILLVGVAGIVRTSIVHYPGPLMLTGWITLAAAFSAASFLIVRDLRRGKHSSKSAFSIAMLLTWAAGTITVVALLKGLGHSSDPKATFNAFYVFVFYFACAMWGLEARIARAELAAREQMLRLECRLADLAERLAK